MCGPIKNVTRNLLLIEVPKVMNDSPFIYMGIPNHSDYMKQEIH